MWEVFSPFGVVEVNLINIILKAVKVLNTPVKYMCIVKFETVAEAIMAIACMHNSDLDGRCI